MVLSHVRPGWRRPQAIWVSITPFGLTGPRAHWRGSDLTCMAAGTGMYVTGDPDRAPLRASEPASYAAHGRRGRRGGTHGTGQRDAPRRRREHAGTAAGDPDERARPLADRR